MSKEFKIHSPGTTNFIETIGLQKTRRKIGGKTIDNLYVMQLT